MLTSQDIRGFLIGVALLAVVAATWAAGFLYAPVDANQGEIYRIIFLHVPSAITSFATAFGLFVFSVWGLKSRSEGALVWGRAAAEVGLLYTVLTLASGSIWGKPTWGVWWTWDARLTTTFLLALLYAAYLLLYSSLTPGPGRVRVLSVLGLIITIDVPVIYKSVTWWRTLHQPPSMLREGGSSMDPEILRTLVTAIFVMIAAAIWLIVLRARNLKLRDELEGASYVQMAG